MKPSRNAIVSRDFFGIGRDSIEVKLATGLKDSSMGVIKNVTVEPLTGVNEQWLCNGDQGWSLPAWVTKLLGEKVISESKPIGVEKAAELSVVDRDLLIVYLRMLTFGKELWGITTCAHKECGAKLDFTFDLSSLERPRDSEGFLKSTSIPCGDKCIKFSFREPNGMDQAAIAGLAVTMPYNAWLDLLERCIVEWEGADSTSTEILSSLPQEILLAIDHTIVEGMCSMDWDIEFTCAECGRDFVSTLDIQSFFWQEVRFSSGQFWEEIHTLALSYHWSEADILALSRWKRKMYLGLIGREFTNDPLH